MKTKGIALLTVVAAVLLCFLPAAAQTADVVQVGILGVSVDANGYYDLSIRAEVTRAGTPAPAQELSLLLIGNRNNGLTDNEIQVAVNGNRQTAYIYHADMVNTAADDMQNNNAENIYVWNFKAKLPDALKASDYVYAFVGVKGALRTDIELTLPNAYLSVDVSTTETDFAIPPYVDGQTQGSRQIPFSAQVIHKEDGILTVPPEEVMWSIESAGTIQEELDGIVSIDGGVLTVTSAAAGLDNKKILVKAAYQGVTNEKEITLQKDESAAAYIMIEQPQPIEVPISGRVKVRLKANVTDQYGTPLAGQILWALEEPIEGAEMNEQTGEITVADTVLAFMGMAAEKQFEVTAHSGNLEGTAAVTLQADRTPVAAVIEGSSTVSVKDQAQNEYELKLADKYGTLYTTQEKVVWTLTAGNDIASVTPDGTKARVVLNAAAEAGKTLALSAVCGALPESRKNISIVAEVPAPASIEITAEAGQNSVKPQITVPNPGAAAAKCVWSARVLNQFGNPMNEYNKEIVWSVLEDTKGAVSVAPVSEAETVVSKAKISVSNEAFSFGKVTLRASYGAAEGTKPLYLVTVPVASTIEIQGDSVVSAYANTSVSKAYTAKVLDQYGRGMLQNVKWSLKQAVGGVTLSNDGVLRAAGAASGTVTLVASTQGQKGEITAEKDVSIQVTRSSGGGTGGGGGGRGTGGAVIPVPVPTPDSEPVMTPVTDLSANHWAYQSIKNMIAQGLVKGDGETGNIRPEEAIRREEVICVLIRALGLQEKAGAILAQEDPSSAWAAGALAAAADAGILKGIQPGIYAGQQNASRAEVMVMIARAMGLENGDTAVLMQFADKTQIPDWAEGAAAALVKRGAVQGYEDGTLRIQQNVTRAETFVMIEKLLTLQKTQ